MTRIANAQFITFIDRMTLVVAVLVAVILPLGFMTLEYRSLVTVAEIRARVKAEAITGVVSRNPDLWMFQVHRIEELLATFPVPIGDTAATAFDMGNVAIVRVGNPPAANFLTRSHPVYDSGRVVGRVEVEYNLKNLIVGTSLAALLGLLLGGAIYAVFRTWPLRVMKRMEAKLDAEQIALQASEARYRTLIDWSPEPVTVLRDGKIIYVNPAAVRLFGATTAQDLTGRVVIDLVHADFRPLALARVKNLTEHGINAPMVEMRFLTLGGLVIDVETQGTAIVYDGVPAIHVAMRDISGRKQAERALRESNERFRDLVGSTDGIVWEADAATFVFNFVSTNAQRLLGYTAADWLQPGFWAEHIFPEDRAKAVQYCATCTVRMEDHEFEYRFVARDGRVVWLRDIVKVVEENGKPRWLRGLMLDITERKNSEAVRVSLEEQLRESQKMEAIGTLAGGIAHDFNNILATILGNTELARQDVSTHPAVLESLDEIRKAGSRARDLVQQILSFSRRQPTELKLTALAGIIAECERLLRVTLPAGVVLDVHSDAGLPMVLADATQMQQVVINLVTNALFAMRNGRGRIGIRLDAVMVDTAFAQTHPALNVFVAEHPGHTLRLTVSDDGLGMDADTLGRIFEPFFTTKAVDEGTGLGLSVVHGIVHAHDGVIEVESQPGKGSMFTVYLPAIAALVAVPAPEEKSTVAPVAPVVSNVPSVVAGPHILYLDDDASLVYLMRRWMERRGYRISAYTDQAEALQALRADPASFDLMVTDYNMPGKSGLDVAREARAIRADLPIAVASGFIDEKLRSQAEGAGVRELIFKVGAVEGLGAAFVRLANTVAEDIRSVRVS